ncbi:MAG: protein kinase, partial [Myxococcales bacterium]|nr:protein kinase [Myxococcales bacterium]
MEDNGTCPLCEGAGPVGEPCRTAACQRREYRYVPAEHLPRDGAHPDAMVGRAIDEYLVVAVLGAGGFGTVYLTLQLPVLMPAALKLMHRDPRDPAMEEVKLQKFKQEAQALARLTHPHIVRLLKYGVRDGAPYMVMEYVEGGR